MKTHVFAFLALLSGLAGGAAAQLPQASAAALALGQNMTASARGFAAVANNPAGLGHRDSPGFSLVLPAVSADIGLGPITFAELADFDGQLVRRARRKTGFGASPLREARAAPWLRASPRSP